MRNFDPLFSDQCRILLVLVVSLFGEGQFAWSEETQKGIEVESAGDQRWAVLVGVNDYAELNDLKYCKSDVEALADQLPNIGFPSENIFLLTDDAGDSKYLPSRNNIRRQLEVVLSLADPQDLVLVVFSGHGMHLEGESFFCPSGAVVKDPQETMISLDFVYQRLETCKARQKLLWVDACRNDPRPPGRKDPRAHRKGVEAFVESLENTPEGILTLASCAAGQVSWEDPNLEHGVFMHYLMEGLSGKADSQSGNKDRMISLLELYKYANLNTKRFVGRERRDLQTPELFGRITGDFILVNLGQPNSDLRIRRDHKAHLQNWLDDFLRKEPDSIPIPDELDTFDSISSFIVEESTKHKPDASVKETRAFNKKLAATAIVAMTRANQFDLQPMQVAQQKSLILQALSILKNLEYPDAEVAFSDMIEVLMQHDNEQVQALGAKYYVEENLKNWFNLSESERDCLNEIMVNHLLNIPPNADNLKMALEVINLYESQSAVSQLETLLRGLSIHYSFSDDKLVVENGRFFQGRLHRLHLTGKKPRVSGSLFDGNELDWDEYRGRVVLLNPWHACPACIGNHQKLKKIYSAYRDKGLTILDLSFEEDRKTVSEYREEHSVPWPTLFHEAGWRQPLAMRFGLMAIPSLILFDREGAVVHADLKPPGIVGELEKLLGEPAIGTLSELEASLK